MKLISSQLVNRFTEEGSTTSTAARNIVCILIIIAEVTLKRG